MTYNLDPSDTNRFDGMEMIFQKIEGLELGEVFRFKIIEADLLQRTRYLIYEWMNLNKIKPFFRIQTLPNSGEITVIRKGVNPKMMKEIKNVAPLSVEEESLLQDMIRCDGEGEAKEHILAKWKEGEIDEEAHSRLWTRYRDVYK